MGKVKLNQPVYGPDGEVTTISELAERGLIKFTKSDNFWGGRKMRVAYFADMTDGSGGWEINKTAYLSRTGQEIDFQSCE